MKICYDQRHLANIMLAWSIWLRQSKTGFCDSWKL